MTKNKTKLNLQHIVFCPKYRRAVLKGDIADTCEKRMKEICEKKGLTIQAIAIQGDHVHVFVSVPCTMTVCKTAQLIKWYSSSHIRRQHPEVKKTVHKKYFWQKNYWSRSVGGDASKVQKYVENQMHHIAHKSQ